MRLPQLFESEPQPIVALDFINPRATGYTDPPGSAPLLEATLAIGPAHTPITDPAHPKHLWEAAEGSDTGIIVVASKGGDDTVNRVEAAIVGNVRNDLVTSAANHVDHHQLSSRVLYIPLAKGNGNNFALSALGRYAKRPELLAGASDLYVGMHRPLEYVVRDIDGNAVQSGIATSCIGIKVAAEIAAKLERQKPALKKLPRLFRLAREGITTLDNLWHSDAFSAEVSVQPKYGEAPPPVTLKDYNALELIGSKIYAKTGRTSVNIDDTKQQIVATRHEQRPVKRAISIGRTILQVVSGRHRIRPAEFASIEAVSIRITSDKAVPFHVDGTVEDNGSEYVLQPGDTLELRLARIAIPVLMRGKAQSQRQIQPYQGRHRRGE